VDVICGGFPCQDISCAGKGAGIHAARSGLWWEMLRIVRLVRPRFVLVENVAALLNRGLDEVLGSLAESGYDAEWQMLRACDFGLPHRRERLFLVAYAKGIRLDEIGVFKNPNNSEFHEGVVWRYSTSMYFECFRRSFPEIPQHIRGCDELPSGLDQCLLGKNWKAGPTDDIQIRMKALGNAIVPACSRYIGECVLAFEESQGKA
jgi:site-specific DNA-cytosine methylase